MQHKTNAKLFHYGAFLFFPLIKPFQADKFKEIVVSKWFIPKAASQAYRNRATKK